MKLSSALVPVLKVVTKWHRFLLFLLGGRTSRRVVVRSFAALSIFWCFSLLFLAAHFLTSLIPISLSNLTTQLTFVADRDERNLQGVIRPPIWQYELYRFLLHPPLQKNRLHQYLVASCAIRRIASISAIDRRYSVNASVGRFSSPVAMLVHMLRGLNDSIPLSNYLFHSFSSSFFRILNWRGEPCVGMSGFHSTWI